MRLCSLLLIPVANNLPDELDIRSQLRAWVRQRSGRDPTDDMPLFDTGLLSSLEVVELLLFLENMKGEEIDLETVEPDVLTSIDTIYRGFFGG